MCSAIFSAYYYHMYFFPCAFTNVFMHFCVNIDLIFSSIFRLHVMMMGVDVSLTSWSLALLIL